MSSILLATRNAHKTREFAALLGPAFPVTDLTSADHLPVVEETGATFAENAILKATTISRLVGETVVADDSGLEVTSLGGAPGVYSARYAATAATDEQNVIKLLAALRERGAGMKERKAQFRCVLALARKGETIGLFDGTVHGHVAHAPTGVAGFGYDPVFVPEGYDRTFAELGDTVKNKISHRARAVAKLRDYLFEKEKGGEIRRP